MRKVFWYLLMGGVVGLTAVIFELLFIMVRQPDYLQRYYVYRVERATQLHNWEEAMQFFVEGFNFRLRKISQQKNRSDYWQVDGTIHTIFLNSRSYKEVFEAMDFELLAKDYGNYWSKQSYFLGLTAYQNQDIVVAEKLLLSPTYLTPQWSYYFFELANFYASTSRVDLVDETITRCSLDSRIQSYCQEHKNQLMTGSRLVGEMRELITKTN